MTNSPVLLIMLAGIMNGSYILPIHFAKRYANETIWLIFSLMAFLITPWIYLFFNPSLLTILTSLSNHILVILILSGFLFGIGMILFTLSLQYIGIGVSFVLNISTSTVLASLLPILIIKPEKLWTVFGATEILALILFCFAIYLSCKAIYNQNTQNLFQKNSRFGIFVGIASGILTSAQGFSYSYTITCLQPKTTPDASLMLLIAPWIPIFTATFIPYFIYFLLLSIHNNSFNKILKTHLPSLIFICGLMSLLYFGSIIVFSQATLLLGYMGSVISWPLFMIFIILTAHFWGFTRKEWSVANKTAMRYLIISLVAFSMAVIILSSEKSRQLL